MSKPYRPFSLTRRNRRVGSSRTGVFLPCRSPKNVSQMTISIYVWLTSDRTTGYLHKPRNKQVKNFLLALWIDSGKIENVAENRRSKMTRRAWRRLACQPWQGAQVQPFIISDSQEIRQHGLRGQDICICSMDTKSPCGEPQGRKP